MTEKTPPRDVHELPGSSPPQSVVAPPYLRKAASTSDLSKSYELSSQPSHQSATSGGGDLLGGGASVKGDGRIDVDLDSKLVQTLAYWYPRRTEQLDQDPPPPPYSPGSGHRKPIGTKLNIVIQVVGSRGDVQPFVALGNELQRYGHRVRIATHDVFEKFVRDSGLEFYPIGGNPAELMAYMVKNPGLIPSMKSLREGEIERKRFMVLTMLEGCWQACIRPDLVTDQPFVADAIIANPPSFAHVHCAQALSIPLHIMFTMPWSSTAAFPHPLANLKGGNFGEDIANYLSYGVVEWMTWQGLGDMINRWRRSIDLEAVLMFDGPILAQRLKIPHTYCWSPALVPKPADWPSHIDVCGFFFRDAPQYEPPAELSAFLADGPKPVYIGFGSIVVGDPGRMITIILDAVRAAGVRAIISKGWSNLSGSQNDQIYYIGDCPHEWLFQHVAAVVHHGGAGTTACGLKYGIPTVIIPFFGDQPFWGSMVAKAGAGPPPIPHKAMNATNLAEAILYCLSDEAAVAAEALAKEIRMETGVEAAAESFHRHLPLERMQCDILPDQPAVWSYIKGKKTLKLSKAAAQTLVSQGQIEAKHLKIYETKPIHLDATRWDPVSGGASAVMATTMDMTGSITGMVTKPIDEYRIERYRLESRKKREDANSATASASGRESPASATSKKRSIRNSPEHGGSLVGKMAGASAKSIAGIAPTAAKGMLVDFPLAITEGLKSVPGHYGGNVRDHGPVTGMKSGAAVAGKTFAWGMIDGVSDLFVQPYKGARKEGALGAVKGVGKGVANLTAKSGAGMFGLFAYNSQGIAKSVRSAFHGKTRKIIMRERHLEGEWLVGTGTIDPPAVVAAFQEWKGYK